MIPCISQVTTLTASFAEDLANAAGAGFPAIEVWLTKLERHLETNSAADTARQVADSGLTLAAASYQGGLFLTDAPKRLAQLEHFKTRLDLCQRFDIPAMLLAADFSSSGDGVTLAWAVKALAEAARWAAGYGVKLALEIQGADTLCNSFSTALALVEACGEPNLGLCFDVFHYYRGSSKFEDVQRLIAANLFHVQVCDVAGLPREAMADADRVMPGDGDFQLEPILAQLHAAGYAGAVSLELMNPMLWSVNAAQVVETGRRALDRLGIAPR